MIFDHFSSHFWPNLVEFGPFYSWKFQKSTVIFDIYRHIPKIPVYFQHFWHFPVYFGVSVRFSVSFCESRKRNNDDLISDDFWPSKFFDFRLSTFTESQKFPANDWPYFTLFHKKMFCAAFLYVQVVCFIFLAKSDWWESCF